MSELRLFARMSDEQQAILPHDAVDPLVIDSGLSHPFQFAVE